MSNQQLPAIPSDSSDLSAQPTDQSAQSRTDVQSPLISYVTSCELPTNFATFQMHAFLEHATGKEHIALTLGDVADGEPVLARLHSECLTGDALFSQRCDCGPQLEMALKKIAEAGRGVLLYLRQEGRGIGLLNKVHAYRLQDQGMDTVEANVHLGFAADLRNYDICEPMFVHLGINRLHLMTNNPRKINALAGMTVKVEQHIPLLIEKNQHNQRYLTTKLNKLGHMM